MLFTTALLKNEANHLEVQLNYVIVIDRKVIVEHDGKEWYNTLLCLFNVMVSTLYMFVVK